MLMKAITYITFYIAEYSEFIESFFNGRTDMIHLWNLSLNLVYSFCFQKYSYSNKVHCKSMYELNPSSKQKQFITHIEREFDLGAENLMFIFFWGALIYG